ncbi:complement C4-like [Larus michahellis]|uniref:complement C4-like n=1 Tax=Larus michahellis TaxID=119627 RepID=UPI003D9BB11E
MGPRWALGLLVLLLLLPLLGGSAQDPQLVLVAPRLVALGTPVGLVVAAVGPVTGTVTAWPGEGDRGATPCAPPAPFRLGTHNGFSQLLHIQVTPEQAGRCGALGAAVGPTLLLEAQSPPLAPRRVRVGLGAPRGVLLVQTDKPLYAPRQTVRFRVFSLDPDLRPNPDPILVTITNPLGARVREGQRVPMGAGAERPDGAARHRAPRDVADPGPARRRAPRPAETPPSPCGPTRCPRSGSGSSPIVGSCCWGPIPPPPCACACACGTRTGARWGAGPSCAWGCGGAPSCGGWSSRAR